MKKRVLILLLLSVVLLQKNYAQEVKEKNSILTNKFQLGIGLYIPSQNVNFKVHANSKDQEIDFGKSFDFNNSVSRPEFSFDWRFSKNWKLAAEYFNASYSNKKTLSEDVNVKGDYTFNKGSNVKLGYKFNLYRIYVGRLISTGQKHELGGGLGVHVLTLGPFIEGNVFINGDDNYFKKAATSITMPLPNIALWYYYALTSKWAVTVNVDWFALKVNEYSGSLWDVSPSVHYQVLNNLAIALDYRYFELDAHVNKSDWDGGFNMSFSGPTITFLWNL